MSVSCICTCILYMCVYLTLDIHLHAFAHTSKIDIYMFMNYTQYMVKRFQMSQAAVQNSEGGSHTDPAGPAWGSHPDTITGRKGYPAGEKLLRESQPLLN